MRNAQGRSERGGAIRICLLLLAAVLVFGGILFVTSRWESDHRTYSGEIGEPDDWLSPKEDVPTIWVGGREYRVRDSVETILLMGLDSDEQPDESGISYNNDLRADFLMLLVIDKEAKTCSSVHIDRDTMANVTVLGVAGQNLGTTWEQIALAHTYGSGRQDSCRNTVKAVRDVLYDTPIDHFLSLTMDAVQILNDEVGGVPVTIPEDMTAIDESFVEGERITLYGEQALRFVRARSGLENNTNQGRMERQRQYLNELYEKVLWNVSVDEEFPARAISKLANYLISDCRVDELQELMETASAYEFVGIETIEGESVVGDDNRMEFTPDQEQLEQLILDLFYEPVENAGDPSGETSEITES